ncbi:hypothetical protein J4229_01120 [Candidatus Pacearchaeota archaeon]|nr:hypothetical protein [Candidatus Pacearchaeota archaeon]
MELSEQEKEIEASGRSLLEGLVQNFEEELGSSVSKEIEVDTISKDYARFRARIAGIVDATLYVYRDPKQAEAALEHFEAEGVNIAFKSDDSDFIYFGADNLEYLA